MRFKSQSAMEYLMTYGWAILIIAIVLIALFQLGVFGNNNLEPKVPAGSCHVYRSVQGASNVGECNGVLPQFVAQFTGISGSYISTQLYFPEGTTEQAFTLSTWVYTTGTCPSSNFYCGILDADNGGAGWGLMSGPTLADFWIAATVSGTTQDMQFTIPNKEWINIVVTYQPSGSQYVSNAYVNGVIIDSNVAITSASRRIAFAVISKAIMC